MIKIFLVRYDLGTVLTRVNGGATISKLSTFPIFPDLGLRGGLSNLNFFQNQKNLPFPPVWGGAKKLWPFPTFWNIFCLGCSL